MANNPNANMRKLAFRTNTRQRWQHVGEKAFAFGDTLSFELPRVGFLAGIFIQVMGNITRGGADTGAASERLYNFLRRIKVNLNIGAATLVDVSGYGLHTQTSTMKPNFVMDRGGSSAAGVLQYVNGATYQDPAIHHFLATPGEVAEPFILTYWVPISLNIEENFNLGLINLQAPEVRCTLDLNVGDVADLFATGAIVAGTSIASGNCKVSYMYYEVPNPQRVLFPPLTLHRILEERTPFSATGDVVYTVPRQGYLLKLMHNAIIANDNNNFMVTDLKLKFNKTDTVYDYKSQENRFLSAFRYGHPLPSGQHIHDLYCASFAPSSGDFRDVIDSESLSTLESIVTISPSAVLGVGNNFVDSVREIVQVLQV